MSDTLNAESIARALQAKLDGLAATVDTQEVSHVDEVGDGIARVSGLRNAMAGELLEFKSSEGFCGTSPPGIMSKAVSLLLL